MVGGHAVQIIREVKLLNDGHKTIEASRFSFRADDARLRHAASSIEIQQLSRFDHCSIADEILPGTQLVKDLALAMHGGSQHEPTILFEEPIGLVWAR